MYCWFWYLENKGYNSIIGSNTVLDLLPRKHGLFDQENDTGK